MAQYSTKKAAQICSELDISRKEEELTVCYEDMHFLPLLSLSTPSIHKTSYLLTSIEEAHHKKRIEKRNRERRGAPLPSTPYDHRGAAAGL
uniref:Cyclin_C domain-containing protein n=1 Tax=Caenorhabditis tropicalis TaxID=1561998 RepID=A0A1I7UQJ3_9PELO